MVCSRRVVFAFECFRSAVCARTIDYLLAIVESMSQSTDYSEVMIARRLAELHISPSKATPYGADAHAEQHQHQQDTSALFVLSHEHAATSQTRFANAMQTQYAQQSQLRTDFGTDAEAEQISESQLVSAFEESLTLEERPGGFMPYCM